MEHRFLDIELKQPITDQERRDIFDTVFSTQGVKSVGTEQAAPYRLKARLNGRVHYLDVRDAIAQIPGVAAVTLMESYDNRLPGLQP